MTEKGKHLKRGIKENPQQSSQGLCEYAFTWHPLSSFRAPPGFIVQGLR